MSWWKSLMAFLLSNDGSSRRPSTEHKAQLFIERYNDEGIFTYLPDGFRVQIGNNSDTTILWSSIDQINAYKIDLMTTDEICLDILANGSVYTITESTAGYFRFVNTMQQQLVNVKENWEESVILPPFETQFTMLYTRSSTLIN